MRKAIALGVICLAASLAFAATEVLQPLNVKTGLWETTQTVKLTGLPPQMAAALNPTMTYKSCVKQKDLNTNAWVNEKAAVKCSSWTVLKSTGSDMELEGNGCGLGNGMTASGRGNIHVADSEHITAVIDYTVTGSGMAIQGHATHTSKWIGATCPADLN